MSRYKKLTALVASGGESAMFWYHEAMINSEVPCELILDKKDLPEISIQVQSLFLSK